MEQAGGALLSGQWLTAIQGTMRRKCQAANGTLLSEAGIPQVGPCKCAQRLDRLQR